MSSVSREQQTPSGHASVNLVYDRKPGRYAEDNRTEFIIVLIGGTSEAEVIIKDCSRGIVLLKLTTDRHEASRGLSTTAELLVLYKENSIRNTGDQKLHLFVFAIT